jgi:hypothetical protein
MALMARANCPISDKAALVARLADLIDHLTHPEVVELTTLPDAMGHAHGLAPQRPGSAAAL